MSAGRESARRAVHVVISGRVQGVGYRAWVAATVSGLGLSGWVRNRRSGEVEAVFSGAADTVEEMLEACKAGPDWARVDKVEVLGAAEVVSGPFDVLPTQ